MPQRGTWDLQKEARWRRALAAQVASGQSVRAWCHKHGVRTPAFYAWRAKLARRDAEAATFAPVRVMPDPAPGRLEILLPGERRVHVVGRVERQVLIEVLAVLAETARAAEAPGC